MANAKRTPKKGIVGDGRVFIGPGEYSNRLHIDVRLSKEDEQRLLKMLQKRYPKAS
jgi:hypothetical protein